MRTLLAAVAAVTATLAGVSPALAATGPEPPLAPSWNRAIPYNVASAADGGRFFVASATFGDPGCWVSLRGIEPASGATAWQRSVAGDACWDTQVAAAGGRVFTFGNGDLTARAAATGEQLWRRTLADGDTGAVPVATSTAIHVLARSTYTGEVAMVTLDAATGAERWRRPMTVGQASRRALAVTASTLYVAVSGCGLIALDRATGAQRWTRKYSPCEGSPGKALLVDGDRLVAWYSRDGFVVERGNGALIRRFTSWQPPARAPGGRLLVTGHDEVRAEDVVTGAPQWRFTGEPPGELELGGFDGALVVATTAYLRDEQDGHLFGLDTATGLPRWRGRLPFLASNPWRRENLRPPLLAHAGTLLVATDARMTGLRPGRPEAEFLSGPPATTASDRATFTFRMPPGLRTVCQLDFEHWIPCRSPHHLRVLEPGAHTLRVMHRPTGPGPHGAPSVAWRWTVTAPPPPPLPSLDGPFPSWDDTVVVSRATGADPLTSTDRSGGSAPAPSCTGRYVAFVSSEELVPGRPGPRTPAEVFVRDLALGVTRSASYGTTGERLSPEYGAGDPAISGDGRYVAFLADDPAFSDEDADDGATPDSPGPKQLYVRDMTTGRTVLASRATGPAGAPSDDDVETPAISGDGRYVAFVTEAQLDPADDPYHPLHETQTVYVRDLLLQRTTMIGDGFRPSISRHGRRIAFRKDFPEGTHRPGVYVHDRAAGTTRLISGVRKQAGQPAISADGRRVAYTAASVTGGRHVSVYDIPSATTFLVSRANGIDGRPARSLSWRPTISADGGAVAFGSEDPELDLAGLEEGSGSVYVRDLRRGTTRLVSRGRGSHGRADGERLMDSALAGDGTSVSFVSDSELLDGVPGGSGIQALARGIADRTAATAALCDAPLPLRSPSP